MPGPRGFYYYLVFVTYSINKISTDSIKKMSGLTIKDIARYKALRKLVHKYKRHHPDASEHKVIKAFKDRYMWYHTLVKRFMLKSKAIQSTKRHRIKVARAILKASASESEYRALKQRMKDANLASKTHIEEEELDEILRPPTSTTTSSSSEDDDGHSSSEDGNTVVPAPATIAGKDDDDVASWMPGGRRHESGPAFDDSDALASSNASADHSVVLVSSSEKEPHGEEDVDDAYYFTVCLNGEDGSVANVEFGNVIVVEQADCLVVFDFSGIDTASDIEETEKPGYMLVNPGCTVSDIAETLASELFARVQAMQFPETATLVSHIYSGEPVQFPYTFVTKRILLVKMPVLNVVPAQPIEVAPPVLAPPESVIEGPQQQEDVVVDNRDIVSHVDPDPDPEEDDDGLTVESLDLGAPPP